MLRVVEQVQGVTRGLLSLLLAAGLLLSACSSTDEEEGPAELQDFEAEQKFRKEWSRSVGDGQGELYNRLTPALTQDAVYAASADGEIAVFDREEGDKRWDHDLDTRLVGGVGVGCGLVMVGTAAGDVTVLDEASGEPLWTSSVLSEVQAPPQCDDGLVYVQTFDGQLIALAAKDGGRVWSYRSTVPVLTLRGTSTPLLYRDMVIAGFANGRVQAFDAATGALRWELRVALAQGNSEIERIADVDGQLLMHGDTLYAVSYQGRVAAVDPNSGRRLWMQDASSYVGMSAGFGNIYVAGIKGSVTAFNKTGDGVRWEQTVLSRRKLTAPVALGSYVIVGDFEGYLHALSQVDGHVAARIQVDSDGLRAPPLVFGDKLLAFGNSGTLAVYTLQED